LALTRSLAADCAPQIRVNAILPGGVVTPALQLLDPELIRKNTGSIPLKRRATPEEIANAALFLATDASSFCTGACLVVDGGRSSILL
jgi:NAD(P)-dependent dehydrogenase (short-subunit alcohol dehydrogenase family)